MRLHDGIEKTRRYFGIEFIDYERSGEGVLISSGAGIALGIMDVIPDLRYFLDIDTYRSRIDVDWETFGVFIGLHRPHRVVMSGWFTIDTPRAFRAIEKGVRQTPTPLHVYCGGGERSLANFIEELLGERQLCQAQAPRQIG